MHWYEDDALWSDFASTMFPPARAESAAALVASSPLLDFPPGSRVLDLVLRTGPVRGAARGARVRGDGRRPLPLDAGAGPGTSAKRRGPMSAWSGPTCSRTRSPAPSTWC
ncbi:hypothetical protein SMICM304S_00415 [Streptomyces microflavus]